MRRALLLVLAFVGIAAAGDLTLGPGSRADRGSKAPFGHARTGNAAIDGRLIVGNRLTTLDNTQNAALQPSVQGSVPDTLLLTVGTGRGGYGFGGVSLIGNATNAATMAGVSLSPKVTLYGVANVLGLFAGFEDDILLTNGPNNGANSYQTSFGFYDHPTIQAPDGQALTMPSYTGYFTTPTFQGLGSGTMAVTEFDGVLASPVLSGGGSLSIFKGVKIPAGSIATTIGLDFEAQTGATLSAGLRCASTASAATRWCLYNTGTAPISSVGGLRLGDNTAPTNKLEVSGGTTLDGAITLWPSITTPITSTQTVMSFAPSSIAINTDNADLRPYNAAPAVAVSAQANVSGYSFAPVATVSTAGFVGRFEGLRNTGTVTVSDTATAALVNAVYNDINVIASTAGKPPPKTRGMTNVTKVSAGNAAIGTMLGMHTLFDQPTVEVTGASSSMTLNNLDTVDSSPLLLANTSGSALTIATRRGMLFSDIGYTLSGTGAVTVTNSVAVDIATQGVTSGNRTVSNVYGIRSALTATSGGTTKWLIGDTGGAGVSLAGDVYIGSTTLTAASAKLHVQQQTAGNEVLRAESVATNDDPNYRIFQQRAATTNATATALHTFTTASDRAYLVEARVVGRCTSGSGCTAGQAISCIFKGTYKNVSGTATLVTPSTSDHCASDITGLTCTTACTVRVNTAPCATATNLCVTVTGLANQNITWHDTLMIQDVGS